MRNVLYAVTRNLYQDMIVSLKSLLYHTKIDNVYLFIEDDCFPYELPDFIKTINVSDQKWFFENSPNVKNRCTYMVMMRVVAGEYMDCDTVLSMDYDTIVKKDISPLFDNDISDLYFAAVREPEKYFPQVPNYFNFGVALLNLKNIEYIEKIAVSLLNTAYFSLVEQDVMNILCQERILELPNKYNANAYTGEYNEKDVIIKHYPGKEKWQFHADLDYKKFLIMPWKEVLSNAE